MEAVISHHLKSCKALHPNAKEHIEDCLYVDDLITWASIVEQSFELYQRAKCIMKEEGLNLRKWNSNLSSLIRRISEVELAHNTNCATIKSIASLLEEEESYSKSCTALLHSENKREYSKLLGVIWDSHTDQLMFKFDDLIDYASILPLSTRLVLKISAKIFDLLGLLGPFII